MSNKTPEGYPRMIGDISYDSAIDTADFNLCGDESMTIQYYTISKVVGEKLYLNEKYDLQKIYDDNYNPELSKKESGLVRIRFIVNCLGEAGRYRILGMDENYKQKEFDSSITDQLLTIAKNRLEWKSLKKANVERDYYMYLIFKIEEGKIIEILP